jgi:hypothetical protein
VFLCSETSARTQDARSSTFLVALRTTRAGNAAFQFLLGGAHASGFYKRETILITGSTIDEISLTIIFISYHTIYDGESVNRLQMRVNQL